MTNWPDRIEALRLNTGDVIVITDDSNEDLAEGLLEALIEQGRMSHLIVQLPIGSTIETMGPDEMDRLCAEWIRMRESS